MFTVWELLLGSHINLSNHRNPFKTLSCPITITVTSGEKFFTAYFVIIVSCHANATFPYSEESFGAKLSQQIRMKCEQHEWHREMGRWETGVENKGGESKRKFNTQKVYPLGSRINVRTLPRNKNKTTLKLNIEGEIASQRIWSETQTFSLGRPGSFSFSSP